MSKKAQLSVELEFPSHLSDKAIKEAIENALMVYVDTESTGADVATTAVQTDGFCLISYDIL